MDYILRIFVAMATIVLIALLLDMLGDFLEPER